MKNIILLLLVFGMLNLTFLPVFASENNVKSSKIINAVYNTELNLNKASKGQVVQFQTTQDYNIEGVKIPRGTIFSGKIKSYKKGRWAYRRAKAHIQIDKMVYPTGETYNISATTKKYVIKGSAAANIGKGVITAPVVAVVGVAGACVILVEAITIVGLVLVAPTGYIIARTMGTLSHGINYKRHSGDSVDLRLRNLSNVAETSYEKSEE